MGWPQALIFGRLDPQRFTVCIRGRTRGLDVREFEYLGALASRVWGMGLGIFDLTAFRVQGLESRI